MWVKLFWIVLGGCFDVALMFSAGNGAICEEGEPCDCDRSEELE